MKSIGGDIILSAANQKTNVYTYIYFVLTSRCDSTCTGTVGRGR